MFMNTHIYSQAWKEKGDEQSRLVVNEGMAARSGTGNRSLFHLQIGGVDLIEIFSE